jgi:hypothetical protein
VNEIVSLDMAEKLSVLYAERYLKESAARGREVGTNDPLQGSEHGARNGESD